MADYTEAPVSRAAALGRRLAVFSAIVFAIAALAHRFGLLATPDVIPVLGVVAALALLSLAFAARGLQQLWTYGGEGGGNVLAAVLVACLVLTPFSVALYRGLTLPSLDDISTDTDDPPVLSAATVERKPGMNVIEPFTPERRKLQHDAYPTATGRRYGAPISQVADSVNDVLDERGWTVLVRPESVEATEVTFEAVARTLVMGFASDVAIRLIDEGNSTYVDMRSASRYGAHDFGDNARRIEAFLADLDVEIAYLTVVVPVEEPPAPEPVAPEPEPELAVPDEPAEPLDRSEDPPD
ncbi:DUF1499 domain-containing protein [Mesorhizobium sp. 10J20-29]|jgi:hypothetical protein